MFHHYLTKYITDGKRYIASWLQLNLFGHRWCFFKKVQQI